MKSILSSENSEKHLVESECILLLYVSMFIKNSQSFYQTYPCNGAIRETSFVALELGIADFRDSRGRYSAKCRYFNFCEVLFKT